MVELEQHLNKNENKQTKHSIMQINLGLMSVSSNIMEEYI